LLSHTSLSHDLPFLLFFIAGPPPHRDLPSFPTRRSSDLIKLGKLFALSLIAFNSAFSATFSVTGAGFSLPGSANWLHADNTNARSEEHTSELQSRFDLVCRLLLEKKKKKKMAHTPDAQSK